MPTSNPTRLTRREFIKLSGATSLGIALSACGVAPTPTATLAHTNTPLQTSTLAPTATLLPTVTIAPSKTPEPTVTPISEVLPLALKEFKKIDVNDIPQVLFGRINLWRDVGGYRYSNSGETGDKSMIEKLQSYPGFDGAVVHTIVDGPPPKSGMQRTYIANDSISSVEGQWAYEVSHLVKKAPDRILNSGWMLDPIVILSSIGFHPDNDPSKFRAAGGVRLITDNGNQYYISVYRVNKDGSTINSNERILFKIGAKQRLRLELFYDDDSNNAPSLRAFLIEPPDSRSTKFIGKMKLDSDISKIYGDLSFLGIYTGYPVVGFEGISGEAKIYR